MDKTIIELYGDLARYNKQLQNEFQEKFIEILQKDGYPLKDFLVVRHDKSYVKNGLNRDNDFIKITAPNDIIFSDVEKLIKKIGDFTIVRIQSHQYY